jgi:hypothetical protein
MNLHYTRITLSNIQVIHESSLYKNHIIKHIGYTWIFILNRQTHRFRLRNCIHKSNIHYILELETLSNIHVKWNYNNIIYVQYMSRTTLLNCNILIFLLTKKSEARWFFFAGFLFFGGERGGGDSWPMTNLVTWCLPGSEMTSSFINLNNYSCTARILYGVRYSLLKSIWCNFKNQRSEVS